MGYGKYGLLRYHIRVDPPHVCFKGQKIFIQNLRSRKNIHTMMAYWYKQIESKKRYFLLLLNHCHGSPSSPSLPQGCQIPLPSFLTLLSLRCLFRKKSFGRERRKGGNRKLSDPPLLLFFFPAKLQPKKKRTKNKKCKKIIFISPVKKKILRAFEFLSTFVTLSGSYYFYSMG